MSKAPPGEVAPLTTESVGLQSTFFDHRRFFLGSGQREGYDDAAIALSTLVVLGRAKRRQAAAVQMFAH